MIPVQRLINEARALCGVPWRHRGRTLSGVDCIGLIALAARNADLDLFSALGVRDRTNYSRKADPELLSIVQGCCTRTHDRQPGCLVFFRFDAEKYPRHFGIYTEYNTVIHAEAKTRGRVVEHGYRAHWVRWTHSLWLLPGLSYVE